jgi:predicted membrane channel-forming protein YqfA (hemolysin III family)
MESLMSSPKMNISKACGAVMLNVLCFMFYVLCFILWVFVSFCWYRMHWDNNPVQWHWRSKEFSAFFVLFLLAIAREKGRWA